MPAPKRGAKGKGKGKGKGKKPMRPEREDRGDFRVRKKRRKVCVFCTDKIGIDFKNAGMVVRFMTDRGKIMPRRMSGCCAKHQRMVATAIKKSREMALVPFVVE